MTLEETLLAVWHQTLVENLKAVRLPNDSFSVHATARHKLKQVDFQFDHRELRGLEQNPNTKSRWAAMAKKGGKVMQFLEHGKYIAAVADGKVYLYSEKK
jgi:hypothetical protein